MTSHDAVGPESSPPPASGTYSRRMEIRAVSSGAMVLPSSTSTSHCMAYFPLPFSRSFSSVTSARPEACSRRSRHSVSVSPPGHWALWSLAISETGLGVSDPAHDTHDDGTHVGGDRITAVRAGPRHRSDSRWIAFHPSVSLGGELVGNQLMTMEHGNQSRRGLLGSFIAVARP